MLVEQLPQSQMLGQRRRQHQSRVGHQMLVVEGHLQPVETVARYRIEIVPSGRECGRCGNHHFPLQEGTFRGCATAIKPYSSVDQG